MRQVLSASASIYAQRMRSGRSVRLVFCRSLSLFWLAALLVVPAWAEQEGLEAKVQEAIVKVKPALVRVHVVYPYYSQGREQKFEATGSGVIVSADGYVVTNHHVAGRAKLISCTLADQREVEAELVGTEALTDISLLKLNIPEGEEVPFATFGDSDKLQVGEVVLAMGSPLALSQSVTRGVVSNLEMTIPELFWPYKFTIEGEEVGSVIAWIGHDAEIYPGNSGGPLVNLAGEIVGINEIWFGLSGAIPSNIAKEAARFLKEKGEVERSWIGLEVQPMLKSTETRTGVLVSGVISGSPAEEAGFQPGDVLIKMAEKEVSVLYPEQLIAFNRFLLSLPIGKVAEAVVLRQGKEVSLSVRPRRRESFEGKDYELKAWGLTAQDITTLRAKVMRRTDTKGAFVTSTLPGGPADEAKPKIESGDVIVEVDGTRIESAQHLGEVTEALLQGGKGPKAVLTRFERDQEVFFTVVQIGMESEQEGWQEARKGWLGVRVQEVTEDLALKLGLKESVGMRITQLFPGSPAEKSGLKVGDVILAVEGEELAEGGIEEKEAFESHIRQYSPGAQVSLTLFREGKEVTIPVELAALPPAEQELPVYRELHADFSVRDLSFYDRVEHRLSQEQGGVLVTEVKEGGWAALAHLATGDIIFEVNGNRVKDVAAFSSMMQNIIGQRPDYIVLRVQRGIHTLFVEIKTHW